MADQGIPGWILFTEELGNDPNDQRGSDYSRWADQGFGIIARLNNGYEPRGTIPLSNRYADFATRCANFARNSRGCHIWIIGNEMNFAVERPGVEFDRSQNPPKLVRPGEIIQPGMYANCYRQCRTAIKGVARTRRRSGDRRRRGPLEPADDLRRQPQRRLGQIPRGHPDHPRPDQLRRYRDPRLHARRRSQADLHRRLHEPAVPEPAV